MGFKVKICYGLIVSSKEKQVINLIDALNINENIIIIHCDLSNEKLYEDLYKLYKDDKNICFISERFKGGWGHVSLMHIELKLMEDSLAYDYDYFTLLSESCLPVKTDEYIKNFLYAHQGTEFIECFLNPTMRYRLHLKHNLPVTATQRKHRNLISAYNILRDFLFGPFIGQKEYNSYKIYSGTQWFTITKGFVKFALHYADEHEFKEKYKNSLMCDEIFMQDIISHSEYKNKLFKNGHRKAATVYINWKVLSAPKILTMKDRKYFEPDYILYARKFDETKSRDVMNYIYALRSLKNRF